MKYVRSSFFNSLNILLSVVLFTSLIISAIYPISMVERLIFSVIWVLIFRGMAFNSRNHFQYSSQILIITNCLFPFLKYEFGIDDISKVYLTSTNPRRSSIRIMTKSYSKIFGIIGCDIAEVEEMIAFIKEVKGLRG